MLFEDKMDSVKQIREYQLATSFWKREEFTEIQQTIPSTIKYGLGIYRISLRNECPPLI